MKTTVRLSGFEGLEQELVKVTKATGRAALRRAGLSALERTASIARRLAPEDTGELIESIDVDARAVGAGKEIGKREYAAALRGGGSKADAVSALRGARRAAGMGGAAPHVELFMGPEKAATRDEAIKAWAQEFGTSKMEPTPYMRPAWDLDKNNLLARLRNDLWFEILTAVQRSQAKAVRR